MRWLHLKSVASNLVPYERCRKIGMLIGTDCPKALRPIEVIAGIENERTVRTEDRAWVGCRRCHVWKAVSEIECGF